MVHDREDARDLAQGAFVKAYEKLGSYDPAYQFFSWIYRILVNDTLNFLERNRPYQPARVRLGRRGARRPPGRPGVAGASAGPSATPSWPCPVDYREVVVLRHFAELSYGEMSVALAIPEKTVKSTALHGPPEARRDPRRPGSSMSRPEHDDLIQGEIDGVNSAAESARLRDLLASRPDLDARLGSLGAVSETLGQAERLDPPPGFVDGVMSAVRRRKPEHRSARDGWLEVLRSLLTPAPLAACACTLICSASFLGGLLPSGVRALLAVGAGGPFGHGALPRPAGCPGTLDRRSFAREGVTGEAVTRIEEGLLVLDLELDATRPFDVNLDLDGTGLSPRSFSQDGPSERRRGDGIGPGALFPPGRPAPVQRLVRHRRSGGRTLRLRLGDGEAWDLSIGRERPR